MIETESDARLEKLRKLKQKISTQIGGSPRQNHVTAPNTVRMEKPINLMADDEPNKTSLPELKSGKAILNLEGMGALNAKGGVGGMARFANNHKMMSVDHSSSMMTQRMVNLREIYWKGEEEAKAQRIKER